MFDADKQTPKVAFHEWDDALGVRFVLFQRVYERDHLPDLFLRQDAFPRNHGSPILAGGNSPEQIIIRDNGT